MGNSNYSPHAREKFDMAAKTNGLVIMHPKKKYSPHAKEKFDASYAAKWLLIGKRK